MNARKKGFS